MDRGTAAATLRNLIVFCEDAVRAGVLNAEEMADNGLLVDARTALVVLLRELREEVDGE